MKKLTVAATATAAFLSLAGAVIAQQAGFVRVPIQTQELSAPNRVAVQARAEFEPGVAAGRHTHPGEELSYVLEGQVELLIDGQPPKVFKAGEAFFVPAGVVHDGRNNGSVKAKLLGTYIVEKGKPLATPAN